MVFFKDNTIGISCDCGCSMLIFKYDLGNVWIYEKADSFYNVQTGIKDIFAKRFKIVKNYLRNEQDYFADVVVKSKDFDEFVKYLNILKQNVLESKNIEDESETYIPSHLYVDYMSDIDEYGISLRGKYTLKDVFTGKIHRFYEPYMNLTDFVKFVDKVNQFYSKTKKDGGINNG